MSDDKRPDFEFQELVSYREQVTKNMEYSIQRIDWLIIALASSGIILSTGILKDNSKIPELKLGLLFFCLAIMLNFISQFVGYSANRKLVEVYNQKIVDYKADPAAFNENDYKVNSDSAYTLGHWVNGLNITSALFLGFGMVCCLLYYYYQSSV